MNKRRWVQHRQAYWPRLEPMLLVGALLTIGLINVFQIYGILGGLVAAPVAFSVVYGRLWIWKRRHPIISPEEWYRHMRENATWN